MKFNSQVHHRRSIRLKGYDYTQPGGYFITMVAFQREHLFGEIENEEIKLTKFGLAAKQQWQKLPKRFPNIELGVFVIMPNHVHGIIQILERTGTASNSENHGDDSSRRAPTANTSTSRGDDSSRRASAEGFKKPIPDSIPTIIRSYKSAVSYRVNLMRGSDGVPVWQRNYYEHVIRNHEDWDRIHRYIEANPSNWAEDKENL